MTHFLISKATKVQGKAQTWELRIRRPYVSAIVWDNVEPGLEFRSAAEAKEHGSQGYGVKSWARHVGRGSAYYHGSNATSEALPVFMVEHDGETCAIFPTLCGTNDADVTCYARIGQHSTASQEFAREAKSVTWSDNDDAHELWREIRAIYQMGNRITDRVTLYLVPKAFKAWMHNARFDAYHKN